jgi:hypothetical protein
MIMSQTKVEIPNIPLESARANVVAWKKGTKKKPNNFINSVWNLVYRYHKGSFKKAAEDVKEITPRMLMKLASAAEVRALSPKIGKLLEEGKISLDVISEFAGIKDLKNSKGPVFTIKRCGVVTKLAGIEDLKRRDKIAEIIAGMHSLDQKQVVKYAKRHPEASLEQFKERVLASKDIRERIYMALLPLNEEEYRTLKEESQKLGMAWDALCMKIITDWLDKRRP